MGHDVQLVLMVTACFSLSVVQCDRVVELVPPCLASDDNSSHTGLEL